ncbi:MAG: type II secretion system protein [bacterium]
MELKRGFSLIELTVVIGLMGLLTLAISSVLLMSIVSSNRIRTITQVKQAGNYTIDQLQTLIRNAKSLVACNPDSSLLLINPDGGLTSISLTGNSLASNSASLIPSGLTISTFKLTCEPNSVSPNLISVSFDLKKSLSTSTRESPTLHFETAINLRNQ